MRRLVSVVAVVLMLIMMSPALACVSGRTMSSSEHQCCASMHGLCGEMAKQGCCQVSVGSDFTQLPSLIGSTAPDLPFVLVALVRPPFDTLMASRDYRWLHSPEHSPPGLLIASTTVLRI